MSTLQVGKQAQEAERERDSRSHSVLFITCSGPQEDIRISFILKGRKREGNSCLPPTPCSWQT